MVYPHLLSRHGDSTAIWFQQYVAHRAELLPTRLQGEGPFYPYTLPIDSDADLARVAGQPRGASTERQPKRVAGDPVAVAKTALGYAEAGGILLFDTI